MRTRKFVNINVLALTLGVALIGCDLEIQKPFEFNPEVSFEDPFAEMTAWEFLQSKGTFLTADGELDFEGFAYMVEAVKVAGFENEYNGDNGDRTYLLLNNSAFTGGGDIINIVTGSADIPEGETPAQTMARADVDKLRKVLSYHIVLAYIQEVPTLYEYGVDYLFQTLIEGEDGVIAFRRDERYRIDINHANSPMPSSSTSQAERVRGHNYVFNNGIGHIIADPVRNQPY